ncbi:MAG: PHB depolymerase family esterase [Planctomycetota bacterium]
MRCVGVVVACAMLAWTVHATCLPTDPGFPDACARSLPFDGLERRYIAVHPAVACPNPPAVVLVHGGSQSMRKVLAPGATTSRWIELSQEFGFVVLVPNGIDTNSPEPGTGLGDFTNGDAQTWNDLRPGADGRRSREDDAGFINAVVAEAIAMDGVDPERVYVTGSSNGGMMAYRMLVEHGERFAAGAAFIANLPEDPIVQPTAPSGVLIMNGDADEFMPWRGGAVAGAGDPVRSTPATLGYWLGANGLDNTLGRTTVLADPEMDGCSVVESLYPAAPGGPPVVGLYRLVGGGHQVPGPAFEGENVPSPVFGIKCRDIAGIDVAWWFLRRFPELPQVVDSNADGVADAFDLGIALGRAAAGDVNALDIDCTGAYDAADVERFAAWVTDPRPR